MTFDEKLRAVIEAPLGPVPRWADTKVIARDGWFQVVTPSAPGTRHNEVMLSRVPDEDVEHVIDDVIKTYSALSLPTKWCVGPWTRPDDLGERLERRGFTSWATRGMGCATVVDLGPAPPHVRVVENDEDLDLYVTTAFEAVAREHIEKERTAFAQAMNDGLLALFLATDGEACVGTGGALLRDRAGYLVGGSVMMHARGRGHYRALVAARLRWLCDHGVPYAVTQAREETSAPILERLGFETLFHGRCYLREPLLIPPPPPPSSAALLRIPSTETDFWDGLFVDLTVRVEWLAQALAAVPRQGASAGAADRLQSYMHAVMELRAALDHVQEHRKNLHLKPLFALEGPVAAFLSRLYAWCEEIGADFERMAAALRRREPTTVVFAHRSINRSYQEFEALTAAMRSSLEISRELHANGDDAWLWQSLDERVEELIWATEWMHMTLARSPGET